MVVIQMGLLFFPAFDAGTNAVLACHQSHCLSRPGIVVSDLISSLTVLTSVPPTVPAKINRVAKQADIMFIVKV
jgi:hypothetical protein